MNLETLIRLIWFIFKYAESHRSRNMIKIKALFQTNFLGSKFWRCWNPIVYYLQIFVCPKSVLVSEIVSCRDLKLVGIVPNPPPSPPLLRHPTRICQTLEGTIHTFTVEPWDIFLKFWISWKKYIFKLWKLYFHSDSFEKPFFKLFLGMVYAPSWHLTS